MMFRGLVRLVRLERNRRSVSVPEINITGQIITRYLFLASPGVPCSEINARTCPYEKTAGE
jgi:hypothetical protein